MSNRPPGTTTAAVIQRSHGICERCQRRRATEMAHRIPRNTGGHLPSNIAHLCASDPATGIVGCHQWAHANPKRAYMEGWAVRANSRVAPSDMDSVPARSRDGWVLLTHDGAKRPIREALAMELLDLYGITPLEVAP